MYGIKAAVRRLPFAPRPKDMKVTDVTNGRFVFAPRAGEPVSQRKLGEAIADAGYEIETVRIEVRGTLAAGDRLEAAGTGQAFTLSGERLAALRDAVRPGTRLIVAGRWRPAAGAGEIEGIEVERWEAAR